MEVYFFRLLLEWGRLTDDRGMRLGFRCKDSVIVSVTVSQSSDHAEQGGCVDIPRRVCVGLVKAHWPPAPTQFCFASSESLRYSRVPT
jgi:hypothetical protein